MNKKLYWGLRIILGIIGVVALYQIVVPLTGLLRLFSDLLKNIKDMSPEFKLILISIGVWVTCSVINTIVNLISKLHLLLEDRLMKEKK